MKGSDSIMFCECFLPALAEAQFSEGGAWTLGKGAADTLAMEKGLLFSVYEKLITQVPPEQATWVAALTLTGLYGRPAAHVCV